MDNYPHSNFRSLFPHAAPPISTTTTSDFQTGSYSWEGRTTTTGATTADVRLPRKAGTSLHFQLGEGNTVVNFYSVDVDVVDDNGDAGIKIDGTAHKGFYVDRDFFSKNEGMTLETADYCAWNDCGGQMEKAAVGSTLAIIGGGVVAVASVVAIRIWRRKKKDHPTRFYRGGSRVSSFEDKDDEMNKVVEMTNSLATIGMNMTNLVLALDRLGPGAVDYASEVEEEQIGKNEEEQDG